MLLLRLGMPLPCRELVGLAGLCEAAPRATPEPSMRRRRRRRKRRGRKGEEGGRGPYSLGLSQCSLEDCTAGDEADAERSVVGDVVGEADYGGETVVWGGQGTFFEESKAARRPGVCKAVGIVPVCAATRFCKEVQSLCLCSKSRGGSSVKQGRVHVRIIIFLPAVGGAESATSRGGEIQPGHGTLSVGRRRALMLSILPRIAGVGRVSPAFSSAVSSCLSEGGYDVQR